jgi:phosphonate transport system permease protein
VLGEGRGQEAVLATLGFSIAAIVLAGLLSGVASLGAARNLATPEPFLPSAAAPGLLRRWAWRAVVGATRVILIFLRAIPEYVWAFLLLNLLGVGAWPAVLALALHNAGILGKLFGETTENLEPHAPRALRALGASRLQIVLAAVFPLALGRWLLYFFYRWETCVREASVLGLLGFVSLGWYIQQSRAGVRYDEMVLFILLGSALILIGDLVSMTARALIRSSG